MADAATVSRTNAAEQDLPGRWVGGALGVLATALVGGTLVVVDAPSGEVHLGFPAVICLLGLPIAFIVGRHFAATLQKPGMESTIWAAMSFGLVAPILGDLEIVGGSLLFPWIWPQHDAEPLLLAALALGFGAVVSYAAAPITLAVGVVWVVLMRLIPPARIARLRMPAPIDRLGVRHLVVALGIWLVVVQAGWGIAEGLGR
jgi:hypothetical protein